LKSRPQAGDERHPIWYLRSPRPSLRWNSISAYGWLEFAMLSKCANPEVEAVTGEFLPQFEERFWLCDECSKTMTVIWGGTQVKLVPLSTQEARNPSAANAEKYVWTRGRPRARATLTNREDQ
jgi:hypothetical protein